MPVKKIEAEQLNEILENLKQTEDYNRVLSLLEEKFNFELDKSNMKAVEVFSENQEENKNYHMVTLPSIDEKSAIEADIFNNEEQLTIKVFGRGKENEGEEKLYIIQEEEIKTIDSLYSNSMNVQNEVSVQDWPTSGCALAPRSPQYPSIPIYYNHCGPGCGDAYSLGGGTPRNTIDICCRAHDRCWANFGSGDCECNAEIVSCAAQNSSVDPETATAIRAWFGSRSC